MSVTTTAAPVPLALYVHLPWCVRKCPYCDFNSHLAPAQLPEDQYVDALLADLDQDLPRVGNRPLLSIFFGGGTPSLFSPQAIERFLTGVHARVSLSRELEVTLEANPGTLERGHFSAYRAAGINRVSLGAQSFSDLHLRRLGRIHESADTVRAVDDLHRAGLANFNLDLMYGLPEQSVAQAIEDVTQALALGPTHLSHYQLTLEPGTVFYHRPPPLPDAELSWEIQIECQALLASGGLAQYEVSAYAHPDGCCIHNLNYWEFGDYLGVGAGAHGKLTLEGESGQKTILRTERLRQPRDYLARSPADRVILRSIAAADLPFEFMLNALRLKRGFTCSQFEQRLGLPLSVVERTLASLEQRGLLVRTGSGWAASDVGYRFLNDLQEAFLASPASVPRLA